MKVKNILLLDKEGIKQTIELKSKIIFLVGPNGTGKSSFIESINWLSSDRKDIAVQFEPMEVSGRPLRDANMLNEINFGISEWKITCEGWKKTGVSKSYYDWANGIKNEKNRLEFELFSKSFLAKSESVYFDGHALKLDLPRNIFVKEDKDLLNEFKKVIMEILDESINEMFFQERAVSKSHKRKAWDERGDELLKVIQEDLNNKLKEHTTTIMEIKIHKMILNDDFEVDDNSIDFSKSVLFIDKFGNERALTKLSSGQMRSLIQLIALTSINSTISFDEPDNFLSPKMVKMFSRQLQNSNSEQIFIVTHSKDLIANVYNSRPDILKLSKEGIQHFSISEIAENNKGNFSISHDTPFFIESLFSESVLIVEGVDDARAIKFCKEINDVLVDRNISIWEANGGGGVKSVMDFCQANGIKYLAFVDNDLTKYQTYIEDGFNLKTTIKENLEEYASEKILSNVDKNLTKKAKKKAINREVRKLFDNYEMPYIKEFYDEVLEALGEEPKDKYTFEFNKV